MNFEMKHRLKLILNRDTKITCPFNNFSEWQTFPPFYFIISIKYDVVNNMLINE